MKTLVACLLLASLTLAPGQCLSQHEKFLLQHTHVGNTLVDCDTHLNPVLQRLNKDCKPCNTVILGDGRYSTNINEVINICRSGTPVRENLYRSNKQFRVVKCNKKTWLAQPPNCKYYKVNDRNIQNKYITVACQDELPVHLEPC